MEPSNRSMRTVCYVSLGVPVELPRAIAERLRKHEIDPSQLFDVTLTDEAVQEHGLRANDVFWIDCPVVEVDSFEELHKPTPDGPSLKVARVTELGGT